MSCRTCSSRSRRRPDNRWKWLVAAVAASGLFATLMLIPSSRNAVLSAAGSAGDQLRREAGGDFVEEDLVVTLLDFSADSASAKKRIGGCLQSIVDGLDSSPRIKIIRYANEEEVIYDGYASRKPLRKAVDTDYIKTPVPSTRDTMLARALAAAEIATNEHRVKHPNGRIFLLVGSNGSVEDVPQAREIARRLAASKVECVAFGMEPRLSTPGETSSGSPAFKQLRVIEQLTYALAPFRDKGHFQMVTRNDFDQWLPQIVGRLNAPIRVAAATPKKGP